MSTTAHQGQRLDPPLGFVSVTRLRPMRNANGGTTWLVHCVRPCGHGITTALGDLAEIARRSCKRCDPSSQRNRQHRRLRLDGRPASLRTVARSLGITASALCQRLQRGWRCSDATTIGRVSTGAGCR